MFMKRFAKDREQALSIADKLSMLVLVLVVFSCFAGYHAITNKVVVQLVPPHLDERTTVAYNSASKSYHIKYGMAAAINMGNVTPASIETTIEALQSTFTSTLYHELKAKLKDQGASLKKNGATLEFKPKTWEYEPETGKTFITGAQTLRPLNGHPTSKTITYEFKIEVNNYVPFINHFVVYNGNAHNRRWLEENSSTRANAS